MLQLKKIPASVKVHVQEYKFFLLKFTSLQVLQHLIQSNKN